MSLPPLLAVADIHARLQTIFPEGTANRNYVTREIAAKTAFVRNGRRRISQEARWHGWRSFAWLMSEPGHIAVLHGGADAEQVRLSDLMRVSLGR